VTSLLAHELVAHVFLTARPGRDDDWAHVVRLWDQCGHELGLTEQLATAEPHPAGRRDDAGLIAVRGTAGPTADLMALRRGDAHTVVLSVQLAPDPAAPRSWPDLQARWERVTEAATDQPVGSTRLLLARLATAGAVLDPDQLDGAVGTDLAVDVRGTGVLRAAPPLGPFAVWEAPLPTEQDVLRRHRRLVVVAGHDRERQLSAWVWRSRIAVAPPLARYLGVAARARHVLRTRPRGDVDALLGAAEQATTAIRALVAGSAGRDPEVPELAATLRPLQALQVGTVDLAGRASELRDVGRRLVVEQRNLSALAGDEPVDTSGPGPFADDHRLIEAGVQQYEHDAAFLDAAAVRARDVAAVADQLLQRGLQRRQEQVTVRLSGVVGALLMGLAAIQALQFTVPLPPAAQGPLIALLTTVALFVPLVVARGPDPHRSIGTDAGVAGSAGAGLASALWLASATGAMTVPSAALPWAVSGVGLGAALLLLLILRRPR
jgi:hypothetical protein